MNLHNLTDIQDVASAVNRLVQSAFDVDRTLLSKGSRSQFPVERMKDSGLVFMGTRDEATMIPFAVYRALLIATQTIGGDIQATVAHAAVM